MKKIRWDLLSIFIGIAAVLTGAYAVIKSGGNGSIFIAIAMIIFFIGIGLILYKLLWKPESNIRRLKKTGIAGKAKILEVHETNITVNNNPQLRLVMELQNSAGNVYTASCKTIVSKFSPVNFKPGNEINVKIDPADEKNVIVD